MEKQIFSLLLVITSLVACNAGNNSNQQSANTLQPKKMVTTKSSHLSSTQQGLPYTMGGTYDTSTGYPTTASSCLNAGVAGAFMINSPQAKLDFSEAQGLSQVLNALGYSIAVTIGWGPFAVTETYNYVNTSINDAYHLNINYIYKYSGTATFPNSVNLQGESALTPSAQNVVGLPVQFRTMCGNRYIAQMDAGASVLIRLQLTFNSSEEKNYFDATLKQIKGLQNVIQIIQQNPNKVKFNLTASGIQVGGNPSLLNNIFLSSGGTIDPNNGYPSINCSNKSGISSTCTNLINQVINYSSTIKNQLNSVEDYYFSNPVAAPWSSIGIYPGEVVPKAKDMESMAEIAALYDEDQQNNTFIQEYQNMLLNDNLMSTNMQQNLADLSDYYQNILAIYTNPSLNIMNCYGGFVSSQCSTILSTIEDQRNQIISTNQNLFNLLDYLNNNQYRTKLIIDNNPETMSLCSLYPISSSAKNLYILNCDGQVSGSLDPNSGISLVPESGGLMSVNNLSYTYINPTGVNNLFTYNLSNPLYQNPSSSNAFEGFADVRVNGSNFKDHQRISLDRNIIH